MARIKKKLKYPARDHLRRVAAALSRPLKSNYILLHGADSIQRGFSDQTYPFDQESNFYYLTGAQSPGWTLLYDIKEDNAVIYIPPQREPRQVAYMGQTESTEQVMASYEVDAAYYHDKLGSAFIQFGAKFYTFTDAALMEALAACRVIKDKYELVALCTANNITCDAHRSIARQLKHYTSERQAEADFLRACRLAGAPTQAYNPIIASGAHASVLHYGANDASFFDAELVLVDAAAEYNRYAADVTRTYPLSGKFSHKARQIYENVYELQMLGISMIRPGQAMQEIHMAVMKRLGEMLVALGFLKCDAETCYKLQLGVAFMMHGLGHQIGLDVHDVSPSKGSVPQKTESFTLQAGQVITIEPGIYFNESFLQTYYEGEHGHHFDQEHIASYASVGGVRIEDCLLVTETGFENLTNLPKHIDAIECLVQEA
ncbi:peptidase M24, structural domain-containing protein [Protomyces lactucae-debilis]|uniref:Peptidase M24, structural domain-containing protein n=1 Tax=Protomyces lactucae-debilis TaxID=2754530 RepID=A0A1Y2EYG6_PROLT|nr:peptidase M24, structural domain-containing protein [Protomyces lactucae-debilis]ORY76610.1 peptidase M24, structural domain-containing protein [Protomyces lactucae-debilis]